MACLANVKEPTNVCDLGLDRLHCSLVHVKVVLGLRGRLGRAGLQYTLASVGAGGR